MNGAKAWRAVTALTRVGEELAKMEKARGGAERGVGKRGGNRMR